MLHSGSMRVIFVYLQIVCRIRLGAHINIFMNWKYAVDLKLILL